MRSAAASLLATVLAIGCDAFQPVEAEIDLPGASLPGPGGSSPADDTPSGAPSSVEAPTAPSCAREHGGRTCGPDGHGDCCATATQGATRIGKYMITAGRMRAFVEAFDGNIDAFVRSLPAERWKPQWNVADAIPKDRASADVVLGPHGKKACEQGAFTGHTYWTPNTETDFSDFDRDVLDEKALNCVPWELLQALCAWDGGRLATLAELRAAFTNEGKSKFPWGDDALERLDAPDPLVRLNMEGAFRTEPLPATYRKREDGLPAEVSFIIAPPGRFPKGDNLAGIADAAGNLLEYVGDAPRQFVWKADFERHGRDAALLTGGDIWMEKTVLAKPWIWGDGQLALQAGTAEQKLGYYAIGGRCAFPINAGE